MVKATSARVVSVHAGSNEDLSKDSQPSIDVEFDGIVGDPHRSFERATWAGDKQPKGTRRRNERQWSAVSIEELTQIGEAMSLERPPSAEDLGVNLCLSGISELSRLPKGTLLRFPSGAELVVEEYNPPCRAMGEQIAKKYRTRSGEPPSTTAFSAAAKFLRGIVGVVEVPGRINAGDTVEVEIYETPSWLRRTSS
jgi:MOSC domain-containing protein YiiM